MAQPILLPRRLGDLRAGGLQRVPGAPQRGPADGHGAALGGLGGELIQQGRVAAGVGEAHLVVLALNLDQQSRRPAHQADADRLIVDRRAGPAVLANDAPQDEVILHVDTLLPEQRQGRVIRRQGEARGDARLFRAIAYQALLGAGAQRQAEAVEQDGFAGAGLPRQHRQPSAEGEVQTLDQHHVAD